MSARASLILQIAVLVCVVGRSKQQQQQSKLCDDYGKFLRSPPSVHGKVKKEGVLPAMNWWNVPKNYFFKRMKMVFNEKHLMLDKDHVLQEGKTFGGGVRIPHSGRCQVFVSHRYKMIYVKIAKTGGTSLIRNFQRLCRKWDKNDTDKTCVGAGFAPTLEPTPEIPNAFAAEKIWKEYFVFAGVRNPFSRAASAYTYLLGRRKGFGTENRTGCEWPSFFEFSKAPFVIGMQSEEYKCIDNKIHDYLHTEIQTQCLQSADGKLAVDYILSMEHLQEDYEGLMQALLQRKGLNSTQIDYFKKINSIQVPELNKVADERSYADDLFEKCGEKCVNSLVRYYKDDFTLLGYESCQQ